ncbi:MAG: serpin family protein, partial [Anaerolineales bacterium]|nr:serpin family protein [Anaerolineales bacterium]
MNIMSNIRKSALVLVLVSLTLAGCAPAVVEQPTPQPTDQETVPVDPTQPTDPSMANIALSNLSRDTNPAVPDSQLSDLVAGNTVFALDFYQAVRQQGGNLFYSPFSLSLALAMTYAGARGETAEQMAEALSFILAAQQLHPAFNALDLELARRGTEPVDVEGETQPFQLNIANSAWAQDDYPFLEEYLDILALNYGSGIHLVDYMQDAEAARQAINDWVSEMTEGKIEDLIPEGALDFYTRLVLANAIYFKANWYFPFDEDLTTDGVFHLLNGEQVVVDMMSHSLPEMMRYTQGNGYQAVQIPYVGGEVAMTVLIPDEGNFSEFEASLDAGLLAAIMDDLEYQSVQLTMPKFEFESEFLLKDVLREMGMPAAFEPGLADFSGMDGSRDLYIDEVIHKAYVGVDEEGTEAAAATAVI